ncbi:MAG TPA: efflux RND transporter periplasmic adaptor subunit [Pseudomonadales bacterium]|nr:efflux RND transporter periplasmic adaptor subunit [Pseudomonadales bacterium]
MRRHRILVVLLAAMMPVACNRQPPPPAPATPEVTVVVMQPQAVTITSNLPGRVTPYRIAQVRARVDGVVLKREFTEGSDVKAGQRLYTIDPAPYEADYHSANAALSRANANLVAKKLQADRTGELLGQHAISKQAYDDISAAAKQAQADVEAAKAELDAARIRLGYTEVLAPIDGRIGKSLVTEGAYVRMGEATPLATVQQLDPVYVDVTQSSSELLKLRNDFMQGLLKQTNGTAKVSLVLEDKSVYPESGSLQFSDSTVDEGTGTFTLRAIFPNSKLYLLPGMFVHAQLESGTNEQALLVPQQAVTYNAKGEPTALVVGAEDKVELRVLQISRSIDNQWLVSAGLKAGDRVITEGLQKARPGVAVKIAAQTVNARP